MGLGPRQRIPLQMCPIGFDEFQVEAGQVGERLDKVLGRRPGCSRTLARKLIDAGAVFVNGRRTRRASRPVRAGDHIRSPRALPEVEEVDLTGRILYRDQELIAVDKPAGLPSAPTPYGQRGTMPEELRRQLQLKDPPRLVHRLDRDVSGVLVLAVGRQGTRRLTAWFQQGRVRKHYRALVGGQPTATAGVFDDPIGADPARPGRMRVSPRGAPARTSYRHLGAAPRFPGCAELELLLHTGRTHQLRVHLAAAGLPVLGDRWYGGLRRVVGIHGEDVTVPRLCLHAHRLEVDPGPGEPGLTLEAPLPEVFQAPD